jgi:hypothetical protein
MKKLSGILMFCVLASFLGAQEAVIREITGTVEVKGPDQESWAPAAAGQSLPQAALISTGFKSSAILEIGNSTLTVRPLTRLSLEEIMENQGNEEVRLYLRTGRIRAEVSPPTGGTVDFRIRSPTITASVRGTAFEFNGVRLNVDEGLVHVTGGDASGVYVGAGHVVQANAQTGKVATVAETIQEALVPSLPVGVETPAEVPASLPAAGNVTGGVIWQ